mmetsp:Transcript_2070/g.3891  ORF Transcript_2070/g.3891 Transcript_2070/m.3891 type:complete len:560 (-) Transcript_2070:247-1926(-)
MEPKESSNDLSVDILGPLSDIRGLLSQAYVNVSGEVGRLEHLCNEYREYQKLLLYQNGSQHNRGRVPETAFVKAALPSPEEEAAEQDVDGNSSQPTAPSDAVAAILERARQIRLDSKKATSSKHGAGSAVRHSASQPQRSASSSSSRPPSKSSSTELQPPRGKPPLVASQNTRSRSASKEIQLNLQSEATRSSTDKRVDSARTFQHNDPSAIVATSSSPRPPPRLPADFRREIASHIQAQAASRPPSTQAHARPMHHERHHPPHRSSKAPSPEDKFRSMLAADGARERRRMGRGGRPPCAPHVARRANAVAVVQAQLWVVETLRDRINWQALQHATCPPRDLATSANLLATALRLNKVLQHVHGEISACNFDNQISWRNRCLRSLLNPDFPRPQSQVWDGKSSPMIAITGSALSALYTWLPLEVVNYSLSLGLVAPPSILTVRDAARCLPAQCARSTPILLGYTKVDELVISSQICMRLEANLLQLYITQALGSALLKASKFAVQRAPQNRWGDSEIHSVVAQCRLIHTLLCRRVTNTQRTTNSKLISLLVVAQKSISQ